MFVFTPLIRLFNFVLHQALKLDGDSIGRIKALDGKSLAIDILGFPGLIYLHFDAEQMLVSFTTQREPNTTIKGPPFSLLRSAFSGEFSANIKMQGEIELARQVQQLFRLLEIDWEEGLSNIFGDIIAHQIGNMIRDAKFAARQVQYGAARQFQEWFHEFAEVSPYRFELASYVSEVSGVRADVDRLEQRIKRLQNRLQPPRA